jgi:hypothetical protein
MKKPSQDKLDSVLTKYMVKPVQAKLVDSEGEASFEFKIHKPFLSRHAINFGDKLFSQKNSTKKNWLSADEIRELLPPTFNVDRQLPPKSDAIDTLFRKLQFGPERKIKKFEFRRFLKELAGYKNYDAQSISVPKAGRASNIRINFNPGTPRSLNDTEQSTSILAQNTKASALSSAGSLKAQEIFGKLDVHRQGQLKVGDLEPHIKTVFEADRSPVPSHSNIQEVFQAFHYDSSQQISLNTFIQLLQQLKSNMTPTTKIPIGTTSPRIVPVEAKSLNELGIRESQVPRAPVEQAKTSMHRFSDLLLSDDESKNDKALTKQTKIPSETILMGSANMPIVRVSKVQTANILPGSKEISPINQNVPRSSHPHFKDQHIFSIVQSNHQAPRQTHPVPSQIVTISEGQANSFQKKECFKLAHTRAMTPKIVKPTLVDNMLQTNKAIMTTSSRKKIKVIFMSQPLNKQGHIKLINLKPVWDAICDQTQHPRLNTSEIHEFFASHKLDPEALVHWKGFKQQLRRFSDPDRSNGKYHSCLKSLF